tara:strand:+ start:978 stop:2081 length:1104 start_codon:yes stop_codon:yes gene_type:complete
MNKNLGTTETPYAADINQFYHYLVNHKFSASNIGVIISEVEFHKYISHMQFINKAEAGGTEITSPAELAIIKTKFDILASIFTQTESDIDSELNSYLDFTDAGGIIEAPAAAAAPSGGLTRKSTKATSPEVKTPTTPAVNQVVNEVPAGLVSDNGVFNHTTMLMDFTLANGTTVSMSLENFKIASTAEVATPKTAGKAPAIPTGKERMVINLPSGLKVEQYLESDHQEYLDMFSDRLDLQQILSNTCTVQQWKAGSQQLFLRKANLPGVRPTQTKNEVRAEKFLALIEEWTNAAPAVTAVAKATKNVSKAQGKAEVLCTFPVLLDWCINNTTSPIYTEMMEGLKNLKVMSTDVPSSVALILKVAASV